MTNHRLPHRTRPTAGFLAIAAGLLALGACGGDDDATDATTAGPTTTVAAAPTTHEHDTASITIGVRDFAFEDVPATIAAGTSISITSSSATEVHELIAVKLPDGDQRTSAELVALPQEELGALIGPAPAAVIIAPPGEAGFPVVGDGTLTEPGRYLLLCTIPIGADPEEYLAAAQTGDGPPQVAGGAPHFTAGMHTTVTVQ